MSTPASTYSVPGTVTGAGLNSRVNSGAIWLIASLGALLVSIPRSRIVLGAPIYMIDILAFVLLAYSLNARVRSWRPPSPVLKVVWVYMAFLLASEVRGMFDYGLGADSIYMMTRYVLAASLAFSVPRLCRSNVDMDGVMKGLVVGLLFSSLVVIAYSLGPTRGMVSRLIFSWDFINPGWRRLLEVQAIYGAGEVAMRGRSPIGAATMTAGVLAIAWPLSFYALHRAKGAPLWRVFCWAASLLAPLAILVTYGRAAWIMVLAIALLATTFNLAGTRRKLVLAGLVLVFVFTQLNFDRSLLFLDRITQETEASLNEALQDKATRERVYSFVEPFKHLMENPSWTLVGVGRAGNRAVRRSEVEQQLYDEGQLATHSGFAMAYYSFGLVAAFCQVGIVLLGWRLILVRLKLVTKWSPNLRLAWQAMLMSWLGMTLWWASGHAIVGEPRGAMLQFFLIGLLVAFDKLTRIRWYQSQEASAAGSA